jgi:hypothetical protein
VAASNSKIAAIDSFQEKILDELPDIAQSVNSGRRSFPEIVPIVRAAGKFKDWLQKTDDATAVISDYAKDVSKAGVGRQVASKVEPVPDHVRAWGRYRHLESYRRGGFGDRSECCGLFPARQTA